MMEEEWLGRWKMLGTGHVGIHYQNIHRCGIRRFGIQHLDSLHPGIDHLDIDCFGAVRSRIPFGIDYLRKILP